MSGGNEFWNLINKLDDGSITKATEAVGPTYQKLLTCVADFKLAAQRLEEALVEAKPIIDIFT